MSTDQQNDAKPEARRKLGRGLSALLGEARREEPLVAPGRDPVPGESPIAPLTRHGDGLANVAVAAIEPHPEQPRRRFDDESLAELAASIAERGVIQPVIVRPLAGGRYQLVAGERRWRAAQKAQLHEIPALIRNLEERDVAALALIENIQREDLNPVEEARAYKRLAQLETCRTWKSPSWSASRAATWRTSFACSRCPRRCSSISRRAGSRWAMRGAVGRADAEALAAASGKRESFGARSREARAQAPATRRPPSPARPPRDRAQDADIVAVQNHLEEVLGLSVKSLPTAIPDRAR
jgi:ParB family chromosome partitioning protein